MNLKGNFLSQEEVKAMIKVSTPSNFRLVKEIFDKGEIEIIKLLPGLEREYVRNCILDLLN